MNESIDRHSALTDNTQPVKQNSQDDSWANSSKSNNSENVLQKVASNIREKPNLDEPVPDSTKEFLSDVEQSAQNIVLHYPH